MNGYVRDLLIWSTPIIIIGSNSNSTTRPGIDTGTSVGIGFVRSVEWTIAVSIIDPVRWNDSDLIRSPTHDASQLLLR
jgi:hypothetical protein